MILRCFSAREEKVKLSFYPCGPDAAQVDCFAGAGEALMIYKTDYTNLLLSYLESEQEDFDVCRDNPIPAHAWNAIILRIEEDMSRIHFDDTVFDFYSRLIRWVTEALEHSDMIMVEGNQ